MNKVNINFKSAFFYHLQKAINLFWQYQDIENQSMDLIDKVFLIEEKNQAFSFILIFSERYVQIYPELENKREVDVKIILDQKEITKTVINEIISFDSNITKEKTEHKGTNEEKNFFKHLKIYGDAHLAKELLHVFEQIDFDLSPYLKPIIPLPILTIANTIPMDHIAKKIIQEILKTRRNIKEGHKQFNQEWGDDG